MSYENLITDLNSGILTITLNRPQALNALNIALLTELGQVFDDVYSKDEIKAVILTGSGEKAFAAGADIAEFTGFHSRGRKRDGSKWPPVIQSDRRMSEAGDRCG